MLRSRRRSLRRSIHMVPRTTAILIAVVGVACAPPGSGPAHRAEEVFEETIDADSQYEAYGLSLVAEHPTEFTRRLLLERLDSETSPVTLKTVRALGTEPPAEAREALSRIFANRRGALRHGAAVALARLGDVEALAWLEQGMAEGDEVLNAEVAALVAGGGAGERVRELLRPHLQSDDIDRRNRAYGVLGAIAEPWSTSLLLEGLEREFGEERLQPIVSLGLSGDAGTARYIEPFVETRGLVFASLEALGALGSPASSATVERMADHEQALVRVYAGVALWRLGGAERARQVLPPLLEDGSAGVRENLARQLEAVEDPAATGLLVRLAQDPEQQVRVAAIRSLEGRPTGADALGVLVDAASDPDDQIGTLALNALARAGSAETLDALQPMLDDPNPYRALAAAHAVLAISDRQSEAAEG